MKKYISIFVFSLITGILSSQETGKITTPQSGAAPVITVNQENILIHGNLEFTLDINANFPIVFDLPGWITEKAGNNWVGGVKKYSFAVAQYLEDTPSREDFVKIRAVNSTLDIQPVSIPVMQISEKRVIRAKGNSTQLSFSLITGAGYTESAEEIIANLKKANIQVVHMMGGNVWDGSFVKEGAEFLKALEDNGIGVVWLFMGAGGGRELPDSWKSGTLKPCPKCNIYSFHNDEYVNWHVERVKRVLVNYPSSIGVGMAEAFFHQWRSVYADVSPFALEKFTKQYLNLEREALTFAEILQDVELYKRWQDFRVDAIINFNQKIKDAIKSVNPDALYISWGIGVRGFSNADIREHFGLDQERIVRELEPDIFMIQTSAEDWTDPHLRPDYIKSYSYIVSALQKANPKVFLAVQADISSASWLWKYEKRDGAWWKTFMDLSLSMGYYHNTAYDYNFYRRQGLWVGEQTPGEILDETSGSTSPLNDAATPVISVIQENVLIQGNLEFTLDVDANFPIVFDLPGWISEKEGNNRGSGAKKYSFTVSQFLEDSPSREGTVKIRAANSTPDVQPVAIPVMQISEKRVIRVKGNSTQIHFPLAADAESTEDIIANLKKANIKVVHFGTSTGWDGSFDNERAELMKALQDNGIGVVWLFMGSGAGRDLPDSWKSGTLKPCPACHYRSYHNDEWVNWQVERVKRVLTNYPSSIGVGMAEAFFHQWRSRYTDVSPFALEKFTKQYLNLGREALTFAEILQDVELYKRWQDFRVDAIINFNQKIKDAIKSVNPDALYISWGIGVRGFSNADIREHFGLDQERIVRELEPDIFMIQTSAEDWTDSHLHPEYIKSYSYIVESLQKANPKVFLAVQTDISSASWLWKFDKRDGAWWKTFMDLSLSIGYYHNTAYDYFFYRRQGLWIE